MNVAFKIIKIPGYNLYSKCNESYLASSVAVHVSNALTSREHQINLVTADMLCVSADHGNERHNVSVALPCC